ncbi:phage tail protein [Microvirga sp. BT350]|uniref:Phage tail protein n=2 Tax=Microvirga alba TaxID=2791025 RepID=A0A931FRB9_9HYPH|nr:phage tail protein [Microvirga alba]
MQLGAFQFGINTAAYQTLQRSSEWRWPSQDRFGKPPVLQHVGQGSETITLPGVIYPEWRGGFGQVEQMRALAGQATPLQLIDGSGATFGKWVIEGVEEKQSVFADAGAPRKQEFTLKLRRFFETDGGLVTLVTGVASVVSAAAGGIPAVSIPPAATGPVSQAQGLANSVASTAKSLSASLSKAYSDVQQAVAPYTAVAADTIGAVVRCVEVADQLQTNANRVLALLGKRPINATAISSAQGLGRTAAGLLTRANSAGVILRNTTAQMEALGTVPKSTVQVVRSAAATADKCAAACRQTATQAATIKE